MSMTPEELLADEISVAWADKLFKELDADERYSQVTKAGKELNSKGKRREQQIANMREGVYNAVLALIEKDPAYANLNNEELVKEALAPTGRSADQIAQDLAESKRKADFMPLIQPTKMPEADGSTVIDQPWRQMDQKALWEKAKEMGYDMNIEKDRKDFLNTLSQYSEQIDRARIVNEFDNSIPGLIASMAYPTATSEARKQAITGNYDDTKMWQSVGLDGATQLAQLTTPGGAATWWMPAAIQGLSEAAREGMQYGLGLGDESFNPSQVFAATVAGATTPAAKGTLQGAMSKSGATKKVAEGIEETTKGTAKDLEQKRFAKLYARGENIATGKESPVDVTDWKSKGKWDNQRSAVEAYQTMKSINPDLTPEEFFKDPNKWTIQDILVTDVEMPMTQKIRNTNKSYETTMTYKDAPTGELTSNSQKLASQLPETYRYVTDEVSKAKKIGHFLGKTAELVGGKIEPTYKVNPLDGDIRKATNNEIPLEEQKWFKKLKPEQKKLIKAVKDGDELLKGLE